MLLHRGIKSKSEKTWGRDGQKSLPFLHTFDILEGSGVRHDNKSDNTQCMKRNRRRTPAKKARKMAYFRAFSMLKILAGLFGFMEFEPNNNNRKM